MCEEQPGKKSAKSLFLTCCQYHWGQESWEMLSSVFSDLCFICLGRRKIRLIEDNAKCCHLKKLTLISLLDSTVYGYFPPTADYYNDFYGLGERKKLHRVSRAKCSGTTSGISQSWAHRSYILSERSKAMSDLWFAERKKMSVERWANCQKKEFAHRSKRSLNLKERTFWAVRSLGDVTVLSFLGGSI
jgi:hypothetical protein